jgi:hypothetical protein
VIYNLIKIYAGQPRKSRCYMVGAILYVCFGVALWLTPSGALADTCNMHWNSSTSGHAFLYETGNSLTWSGYTGGLQAQHIYMQPTTIGVNSWDVPWTSPIGDSTNGATTVSFIMGSGNSSEAKFLSVTGFGIYVFDSAYVQMCSQQFIKTGYTPENIRVWITNPIQDGILNMYGSTTTEWFFNVAWTPPISSVRESNPCISWSGTNPYGNVVYLKTCAQGVTFDYDMNVYFPIDITEGSWSVVPSVVFDGQTIYGDSFALTVTNTKPLAYRYRCESNHFLTDWVCELVNASLDAFDYAFIPKTSISSHMAESKKLAQQVWPVKYLTDIRTVVSTAATATSTYHVIIRGQDVSEPVRTNISSNISETVKAQIARLSHYLYAFILVGIYIMGAFIIF